MEAVSEIVPLVGFYSEFSELIVNGDMKKAVELISRLDDDRVSPLGGLLAKVGGEYESVSD